MVVAQAAPDVSSAASATQAYGDMLADIKERQDQQAKPTIKGNSDKNGYVKHARRPGRRTDIMSDPTVIAERKKALLPLDTAE
ncbi:hypothetical protein L904_24955 [Agrobacterium sp. LY4]|nr:hypothetical protein L904_24955 [Agrobacterium sp. LY4]